MPADNHSVRHNDDNSDNTFSFRRLLTMYDKKELKGLYIGTVLGVGAVTAAEYLVSKVMPIQQTPNSHFPKYPILEKREPFQIILFFQNILPVYHDPNATFENIIRCEDTEQLREYFNIPSGYVGWMFPTPWPDNTVTIDKPPLLNILVVEKFKNSSRRSYKKISKIISNH